MKSVTVMSGPAIRQLKAENARLREQNRRLKKALDAAWEVEGAVAGGGHLTDEEVVRFQLALAAASEAIE